MTTSVTRALRAVFRTFRVLPSYFLPYILCVLIAHLALIIPWSSVFKIITSLWAVVTPVAAIVIFLEFVVTFCRDHPLSISEDSIMHKWSGLWLLRHTRPTLRIYRLLQRAGIVRYRLPDLPTEIWEQILAFGLDIPEALGTTCTPEGILEYLYYHRFQEYIRSGKRVHTYTKSPTTRSASMEDYAVDPDHPYEAYLQRRLTLSLVCSDWHTFVRRQRPAWSFGTVEPGLQTVERLELVLPPAGVTLFDKESPNPKLRDDDLKELRILAIGTSLFLPRDGANLQRALADLSMYRPAVLRNIECLAYTGLHINNFDVVCNLFENLTTLIIEANWISNMKLELPRVQVLMLKAFEMDVGRWNCPALQHLALVYTDHPDPSPEPLPLDIHRLISPSLLLSLVVHRRILVVDQAFWHEHPSLVHIGSSHLEYHSPPPRNHPLSHLSIVDRIHSKTSPAGFRHLVESGHPLVCVRFSPYDVFRPESLSPEWDALYWCTQRRGILGPIIPPELIDTRPEIALKGQQWKWRAMSSLRIPSSWPRKRDRWLEKFWEFVDGRIIGKFPLVRSVEGIMAASYLGSAIGATHVYWFLELQTVRIHVVTELFGLALLLLLVAYQEIRS